MSVKSTSIWVAACVGAALLSGCGGAQSRFDAHMKRGQAYFAQADYVKASIEYRNALQIEPKNAAARLAAGHAAEKLQKPRDAYGMYQSVVDADADNLEARKDLARLLVYFHNPQQAQKTIEPAFAKHPDDAALLTLRAAAREQLNDRDGAIADVDRALKLAPDNEDAIQVRAGIYKQMNQAPEAKTLVDAAVKRAPKSIGLHNILIDLDLITGDVTGAQQQLSELIKLAPQDAQYRFRLALLYSRTKKLDDAQRVLEDTVKALPQSDQAKLTLVDFLANERTPAQAEQVLRGFIAQNPDDYPLRLGLGSLLQRAGKSPAAIAAYNDIVKSDGTGPNGLTARDRLADIASAQGHDDEALKLVAVVLEKNSRDNDALARRAAIELARNDSAAAIGDLRALLRDHPQSVPVLRMIASAYSANGEPGLAEQSLRSAMDVAPQDPAVRGQLAQVLMETQRSDQAVTLLEDAVRAAPKDAALRIQLCRAYLGKQDFENARKTAEDLKTLQPQSAGGYYLAGMAAVGQNKLDEAQNELEHSLQLQPGAIDALTALTRLYIGRGERPKAEALVKDTAARNTQNATVLNLLGELYFGDKNNTGAIDVLTRATTLAPRWWVPYRNLALAKLANGDTNGSVAAYEQALKNAPGETQVVTELAAIYESHHRVDDAIALYDSAYKRNPHAAVLANNLAMLLVSYKTDRASLDRARDLTAPFAASNDGVLLDTNGWVRFKRGEYAEALPVLGRAVDRAPDTKEIRYHLGMAELHAGQTDRARADLESATSGAAKYFGADEARSTLASLRGQSTG